MTTCATEQTTRYARPRVNIAEREDSFVIEADLPGVTKEDVNVSVDQGDLIIEGRRNTDTNGERYVLQERGAAGYRRRFTLGEHVDADSVDATYENGVLTVSLKKSNWAKVREVKVN